MEITNSPRNPERDKAAAVSRSRRARNSAGPENCSSGTWVSHQNSHNAELAGNHPKRQYFEGQTDKSQEHQVFGVQSFTIYVC